MEKKLNISLIKDLLYLEVKDYYEKKKKKEELENNASLLEELINILNSEDYDKMEESYLLFYAIIPIYYSQEATEGILSSLIKHITYCKNYTNEPEKYLEEDLKKGKKYIKELVNRLNGIKEKINAEIIFTTPNISEETINEYKAIINKLKFNKEISPYEYELLVNLLKSKKMNDTEIILLLEKIKNHNIRTHIKGKINFDKENEITNIVLSGFEPLEEITWLEDERKTQLDSLIDIITRQDKKIDETITLDLLPKYKGNLTFSENYTLACVKYIYTNILKYYQEKLLEYLNDLNNLNNYQDKELRNMLVLEYKKYEKIYIFFRDLMYKEIEKYTNDLEKINQKDEDVNTLYYGTKDNGSTFLESDLSDIPNDTYSSIKELLMLLRKNKLPPAKDEKLTGPLSDCHAIKDDQIRIIYKHLKGNEYVIIGVFLKKDNSISKKDLVYYNRKPASIINSKDVEEEIFSSLLHHSGGRRNA